MAKQIFVNLPVKDLRRAVAFFSSLGFTCDPRFTNENASCMIVGDNIFVMLLVESFFKTSAKRAGSSADTIAAQWKTTVPARRFGTASEFGQTCAFLCSVHAGYITSQNILTDGGLYPSAF